MGNFAEAGKIKDEMKKRDATRREKLAGYFFDFVDGKLHAALGLRAYRHPCAVRQGHNFRVWPCVLALAVINEHVGFERDGVLPQSLFYYVEGCRFSIVGLRMSDSTPQKTRSRCSMKNSSE